MSTHSLPYIQPAPSKVTKHGQNYFLSAISEDVELRAEFKDFTNSVFTDTFLFRLELSFLARDRLESVVESKCHE